MCSVSSLCETHPIRVMHKVRQHAKLVASEPYIRATDGYFSGSRIEDQVTASQLRIDLPAGAPDQSSQPGEQFFHAEGFAR